MERIGFSLAGEGRGHAARVVALSQILRHRFEIVFFCPAPVVGFITKHIPDADIEPVPSLNFVKNGHGISYLRTLTSSLGKLWTLKRDIEELSDRMRRRELAVLISDFEPYGAWAAAECDIPILALNHPGVVLKYLSPAPDALVAQVVTTMMMPPAQKTIICSFYRGDVGPIIRKEIREANPVFGDYYLVYAKDDSRETVKEVLKKFSSENFKVFPDPDLDFTEVLIGCRAVIAPAGHQLISEALVLGKPILAIPQKGQYEQRLNARMLRLSGRGESGRLNTLEKDLTKFLARIDRFPGSCAKVVEDLETFKYQDETDRAALMIETFVADSASSRRVRRFQYNWLRTLPEKLEALKALPLRVPA